ncbi:MAG: tetratricopeptide repeat protein [Verrucomicrobiales bacterium]|nr:tetratricopeptide repeat protein [Verrucomicrobiales bacterium]
MKPHIALVFALLIVPHAAPAAFVNLTPVPSSSGSSQPLSPSYDPTTYYYVTTRIDGIKTVSTPDRSEAPPRLNIRSTTEIIDETATLYSDNALKKARLQFASGNDSAALSSIDQALAYAPQNPAAITLRGIISAKRKRYGAAIVDYTKAIEYGIDYFEAYHSRAISRTKINQNDEALNDFNHVVRLAPTFAEAYHKRGLLYAKIGKLEAALEDFTTFTKLRPNDPIGYNNKIAALMKLDRRDEAEAIYTKLKSFEANAAKNR